MGSERLHPALGATQLSSGRTGFPQCASYSHARCPSRVLSCSFSVPGAGLGTAGQPHPNEFTLHGWFRGRILAVGDLVSANPFQRHSRQ